MIVYLRPEQESHDIRFSAQRPWGGPDVGHGQGERPPPSLRLLPSPTHPLLSSSHQLRHVPRGARRGAPPCCRLPVVASLIVASLIAVSRSGAVQAAFGQAHTQMAGGHRVGADDLERWA